MTNLKKSNEIKQFIFFEHTPDLLLDNKSTTIKYTFSKDLMNQITGSYDEDLDYKAFNLILAYLHKLELKDENKNLRKPNLQDLFKLLHDLIIQKKNDTSLASKSSDAPLNLCNLLKELTNNESTERIIYYGPKEESSNNVESTTSEESTNDAKSVAYASMKEHLPNLYKTEPSDLDPAHVTIVNTHFNNLSDLTSAENPEESLKSDILKSLFNSIETVESKTNNTFNLLIPLSNGNTAHFYEISNFSGDWNVFKDKAGQASDSSNFESLCNDSGIWGLHIQVEATQILNKYYFLDCNPNNIKEKTKFEITCHLDLLTFIGLSSEYMLDKKTNKLDRFLEKGLKTYGPGIAKDITPVHNVEDLFGPKIETRDLADYLQGPKYGQMSSALFIKPSDSLTIDKLFSKTEYKGITKARGTDFTGDLTYIYSDLDSSTLKNKYLNYLSEDNIINIYQKLNKDGYAIAIEAVLKQKCFSGICYDIVGKIEEGAISKPLIVCPNAAPLCHDKVVIETIYFYSTINHKQDYLDTFSEFNFKNLTSKLSSDYYLPNNGPIQKSQFIEIEYKIATQPYYLIVTNAEAKDFLIKNQEKFTLDELNKNLLERNCFVYNIHKIDLNKSFTFYEPRKVEGKDDYMVSSVNIKYDDANLASTIKDLAYKSNTVKEFVEEIKRLKIKNEINVISEQSGKVQYLWEPTPDKDFIMKRHKYICIPNTEVDKALQDGKFENFKTFIEKNKGSDEFMNLDTGHGVNFFRRVEKDVERFAFFFLDVDDERNALTYVIHSYIDNDYSGDKDKIYRFGAWIKHYYTFKKMSGYKFSTFWALYTKFDNNHEYKIYGEKQDTTRYRIASADWARSTAPSEIFDPIRREINSDWAWAWGSINTCYNNFPSENCGEYRFAKELQKKGYGFCDT